MNVHRTQKAQQFSPITVEGTDATMNYYYFFTWHYTHTMAIPQNDPGDRRMVFLSVLVDLEYL